MAGSKEEKKTLLGRTSHFLSKYSRPHRLREEQVTVFSSKPSAEIEHYATWPPEKFRATIYETALKISTSYFTDLRSQLLVEVESAVNQQCPFEFEEQIDFCLVCAQADHVEAVQLQEQLSVEYDVTGKVLWECATAGSDIFSVFEGMLQRSSLFLFYITEKYDDSDACAHVAKNLLITPHFQQFQGRVIPLIKDFNTPIPETFRLIDKLCLSSRLQFSFRFPAVFSPQIRQEKVQRSMNLKRKLDEQRTILLNHLVHKKVGES